MKKNNVLLIGQPISYGLVDDELLKANDIFPIYSYKSDSREKISINAPAVFYEKLSIDAFETIIKQTRPNAIVCFNDNFLIQTAQLRDKFGISGLNSEEIKKFKIKSHMYQALKGIIETPKSIAIAPSASLESIREALGDGEYFIKPDNLAGAEGTVHITSLEMLDNWINHSSLQERSYLIQKYYNLPLVHCELYIYQGEVQYVQARRYSYPNHMFLEGKIISSFPIEDRNLRDKIERSAKEVAKALNYHNGVMHTEFFVNHDESLIFLETNIRQAGGAINLIHKKRSGISMETAMILLEMEKPLPLKKNFSDYDICGYIPMQKGKVIEIEIPKLKGDYHFDVRVNVGEICLAPSSASNTAVAFWGGSHCFRDLEDDFRLLENNSIIKYQTVT